MKIKEIAQKKDLDKFIKDEKAKLLKLQFDVSAKESNKVTDIKKKRQNIARALTVKRQRELAKEAVNQKSGK